MPFRDEAELYWAVKEAARQWDSHRNGAAPSSGPPERPFQYSEMRSGGRLVHLLGDDGSCAETVVEFVHTELVPRIDCCPQRWLLLREGADTIVENSFRDPKGYYLHGLAAHYGLPDMALSDERRWKGHSLQRYIQLLQDYPERTDVIVSAGLNRMPAFG